MDTTTNQDMFELAGFNETANLAFGDADTSRELFGGFETIHHLSSAGLSSVFERFGHLFKIGGRTPMYGAASMTKVRVGQTV